MKIASILIALVGAVAFSWWLSSQPAPLPIPERVYEAYTVPALGVEYRNDTYRFSVRLPEGYVSREMQDGEVTTILLEEQVSSLSYGPAGIQIAVTPFSEDIRALTEEMIRNDIPDMAVHNPQVVEIGDAHTGLAFISDNEAFDGASREVWFIFAGNLYQISTYAHLDTLLQTLFQTWQFF